MEVSILSVLEHQGVAASLNGPEPLNKAEFDERVIIHSGECPPWVEIAEALLEAARMEARSRIQIEAERRIDVGLITNGKPFKTDDSTLQTLTGLVQGFVDGDVPVGGFTFSTAAGDAVTYDTEAGTDFIRRIANAYRAQVKAASHVLQTMDPIPADYANDVHWPNYVDVI